MTPRSMIRYQEENYSLKHTDSFPDGVIPITESKHGFIRLAKAMPISTAPSLPSSLV